MHFGWCSVANTLRPVFGRALKSETFVVIDDRHPGEPERPQLSNFRYYQDRLTGDLCIRLTRFGQRDADNWKDADYYEYRVKL